MLSRTFTLQLAYTSILALGCILLLMVTLIPNNSDAMPVFARKYDISCAACHSAFPKLNEFGEYFADNNMRLPNWRDSTISGGDDMLALPDSVPLALRAQAYVQAREASNIDVETGEEITADTDIQSPYQIKLLSGAPLSDHITYYFYAIFAEKGGNGEVVVEDAWFRHDDVFGTNIGMMLGQFQVSDLMFAREIRLPFQDYVAYRLAGLTYERGILFDYALGPVDLALGVINGNGIDDNFAINSPGYKRPDRLFDNNNGKAVFGRVGTDIAGVNAGLFGYSGSQKNATDPAGLGVGERDTDKISYGIDLSGKIGDKTYWYAQLLQNQWDGFLQADTNYRWFGSFAGVDYIHSNRWAYSLLYNYNDANDFKNTDTVYEGIDMNTLTFTAAYYFMRNVKGVIELNLDLLDTVPQSGNYFTGHLTGENYALAGFDAAF